MGGQGVRRRDWGTVSQWSTGPLSLDLDGGFGKAGEKGQLPPRVVLGAATPPHPVTATHRFTVVCALRPTAGEVGAGGAASPDGETEAPSMKSLPRVTRLASGRDVGGSWQAGSRAPLTIGPPRCPDLTELSSVPRPGAPAWPSPPSPALADVWPRPSVHFPASAPAQT